MEDYDEDTQDAIYAAVDRVNMMLNSNEIMGVYIVNGAEREVRAACFFLKITKK